MVLRPAYPPPHQSPNMEHPSGDESLGENQSYFQQAQQQQQQQQQQQGQNFMLYGYPLPAGSNSPYRGGQPSPYRSGSPYTQQTYAQPSPPQQHQEIVSPPPYPSMQSTPYPPAPYPSSPQQPSWTVPPPGVIPNPQYSPQPTPPYPGFYAEYGGSTSRYPLSQSGFTPSSQSQSPPLPPGNTAYSGPTYAQPETRPSDMDDFIYSHRPFPVKVEENDGASALAESREDGSERGLMGALAGGAVGGFAGHKANHGVIGALAGAFAGHKIQDTVKKHHNKPSSRRSSTSSSSSSSSDDEKKKYKKNNNRPYPPISYHTPASCLHQQQQQHNNNNNSNNSRLLGNFSLSAQRITLDRDYDLIAECGTINGGRKLTSIDLNQCLTNDDGRFRWSAHGNFGASARNVRLTRGGRFLEAELRNCQGDWRWDEICLDEKIENSDGDLRML